MFCTGCGKANDRVPQRYCRKCHARIQREWRKKQTKLMRELKAEVRRLREDIRLLLKQGERK